MFLKTALSWDYITSSHIIQYPFKVNKWFLEYSELNNHHHNTILEHFHHPQKKLCEQVYDRHMLSFLWDIFLGVELEDHIVTLCLTSEKPQTVFKGLFSHQGMRFWFLHILIYITLVMVCFSIVVILVGMRWYLLVFWSTFLWWLMVFSIFSSAQWPSVCLFRSFAHF